MSGNQTRLLQFTDANRQVEAFLNQIDEAISVNEPSSELLRQFTQVDHVNYVALVAEISVAGREVIIGEARYVRDAEASSSAEFAVSVAEPWQSKGLAKLMLTKLECWAAATGVRRMVAETLATNRKMLSLARKIGYVVSESPGARGVMRLEKALAIRNQIPAQPTAVRALGDARPLEPAGRNARLLAGQANRHIILTAND